MEKIFKSKIIKFYGNTFRIKKMGFKALLSKMTFLQKLPSTFSKLDIFKNVQFSKPNYYFCGKPRFPRTPLPCRETKVSPATPSFIMLYY
jgi:hypothetical protein